MVEAVLYESENSSFYVLSEYYNKRCPFMLLLIVHLTDNCSLNVDSNIVVMLILEVMCVHMWVCERVCRRVLYLDYMTVARETE